MCSPSVGDHLRTTETHDSPGTYRVVGVDELQVTLLRVGDGDGRRTHTGETVRVERTALDAFDPAEPPTGSGPGAATVAYWSARAFGAELAARPLPAGVGGVLVFAPLVVAVPSPVGGVLTAVGGLLLALVGSGRLRG